MDSFQNLFNFLSWSQGLNLSLFWFRMCNHDFLHLERSIPLFYFQTFYADRHSPESSLSFSYARTDSSWKTSFCLVLDVKLRHLRFKIKFSTITFCICLGSISVARLPVCKLKVEAHERRKVFESVQWQGQFSEHNKQPQ